MDDVAIEARAPERFVMLLLAVFAAACCGSNRPGLLALRAR
jgi:hypothetical protein